jgi:hypothetical protein
MMWIGISEESKVPLKFNVISVRAKGGENWDQLTRKCVKFFTVIASRKSVEEENDERQIPGLADDDRSPSWTKLSCVHYRIVSLVF